MKSKLLSSAVTLALVCASQATFAQQWQTEGKLSLKAHHSDNPRLNFSSNEDTVETHEVITLSALRNTRNLDLRVDLEAQFVQFAGSDVFDNEANQRLRTSLTYRPSERWEYYLDGSYNQEDYSTRAAGAPEFDDEQAPIDGEIIDNQQQFDIERLRAVPGFKRDLGPRASLGAQFEYYKTSYSDEVDLSDYDTTEARLNWIYSLSDKRHDRFKVTLGYKQYDSSDLLNGQAGLKADGMPLTLTYERPFTDNLYMAVSAGATRIEFDDAAIADETEPLLGFYFGGTTRSERVRYAIGYNDAVQPNSTGRLIKSQSIRGSYAYRLTRGSSLGINLAAFNNETVTGDDAQSNREYIAAEPYYEIEFGRRVDLRFSYRYRTLNRDVVDTQISDQDADDHAVFVTLNLELWGRQDEQ